MDIPPIIASSILSKELADVCLVVMLERVKSKIGVYVAWSGVFRLDDLTWLQV